MRDIIKEGIKLNHALALLPLKAVRRLTGDKNTEARQLVDVAEDIIGAPFVAAATVIDNSKPACKESGGGPSFRNVWVNPEVRVFSDVDIDNGEKRAILTVTGLLCGG